MHKQKVVNEDGIPVYRYLLNCRLCDHWLMPSKGHIGKCTKHDSRVAGQTLSCSDFACADPVYPVLESARIDGEFTKVTIGDVVYYCDANEVAELMAVLSD